MRRLPPPATPLLDHLRESQRGITALADKLAQIDRWGAALRRRLADGGSLLVAGNGGSAALGHHLAAELVGRYDRDRRPFSALALSAETAGLTAIGNDYGFDECFARQVQAHGRPGDVVLALSTSGASVNLLRAVDAADRCGATSWAMTGPAPNPLAGAVDEVFTVECAGTASVQDVQQVAVHLLCLAFEEAGRRS
jgi:D-sedoheptulose 7-phosphate isomerase